MSNPQHIAAESPSRAGGDSAVSFFFNNPKQDNIMTNFNVKKLNHISLFTGIGGCTASIKQAGIPLQTVAISEIDRTKESIYNAIHGETLNLGDILRITKNEIQSLGHIDILTAGFPCQSFSRLGSRKGFSCEKLQALLGSMTNIINWARPNYILLENVSSINDSKHAEGLQSLIWRMLRMGYTMTSCTINPADHGWMQSRGRYYMAFSKNTMPTWHVSSKGIGTLQQSWADIKDGRPAESQYFIIPSAHRIGKDPRNKNWEITDNSIRTNCITRGMIDSRDSRGSYVKTKTAWRSFSSNELFRLFGWEKFPRNIVNKKQGISRSSFARGMGDSWHVGVVSGLFAQLPEPFSFERDLSFFGQFLFLDEIEKWENKRVARRIRRAHSYESLAFHKGKLRGLMSKTSHKFDMRDGSNLVAVGKYLSPSQEAGMGINTCPKAGQCGKKDSKGRPNCITGTGRQVFHVQTRIKKTRLLYGYTLRYMVQWMKEIYIRAEKAAKKEDTIIVRNNGTSDIRWEKLIRMNKVCTLWNVKTFYDYSKMYRQVMKNYWITYSLNEQPDSPEIAKRMIRQGSSVAVVMHEKDMKTLLNMGVSYPIVNGDLHDFRSEDPAGALVLLKAKGTLRSSETGEEFIQSIDQVLDFIEELATCEIS